MDLSNMIVKRLSLEPSLAWKLVVNVLGTDPESADAKQAAATTRDAPLVATLLSERDAQGNIPHPAYKKWNGAHWVLSILADLGYPPGDESLRPMMEQCYAAWLSKAHEKYIRTIQGRVRRCASQEGNAIWYSLRLGLADARTQQLAERLVKWQWSDGGWNCDKNPEASISSFMETLIPLRALGLYAKASGDPRAQRSAERAAEIFLKRRLFKRQRDGAVMDQHFVLLHYPPYWHYDILFALKVMAETGFVIDPRCSDALDLLESKRLPDGGFPTEESHSRTTRPELSGYSLVNWGGKSKIHMNPFVTADALHVLRASGREK